MPELSRELTTVCRGEIQHTVCGGNQMWFHDPVLRRCGCGIVCALDLLIYLSRSQGTTIDLLRDLPEGMIPAEQYECLAKQLCRQGLPVLYPVGLNTFVLAAGLNGILRRNRIPYRTAWYVAGSKLWEEMDRMLEEDLPVILSVGKNFPNLWGKERLNLYRSMEEGTAERPVRVKSHYITVLGVNGEWLKISSWGKCYYIRKSEYEAYRKVSGGLMSNLLRIERIK